VQRGADEALGIPNPLGLLPGMEPFDHQHQIFGSHDRLRRGDVDVDEVLKTRERKVPLPVIERHGRQLDAIPFRDFKPRRRVGGTFEMDVNFGFGHGGNPMPEHWLERGGLLQADGEFLRVFRT
jgi:hypothetical protein